MDPKFEVMVDGTIKAPFETEAEVVAYRIEHQDAIAAYNASKVAQPVSRDTPTDLGAILIGDEPEPAGELVLPERRYSSPVAPQPVQVQETVDEPVQARKPVDGSVRSVVTAYADAAQKRLSVFFA